MNESDNAPPHQQKLREQQTEISFALPFANSC
jgi:hypothetical protein